MMLPTVTRFLKVLNLWRGAFLLLLLFGLPACGERSETVVSIAIHPTKSDIIYIATDEAVYKTRDGGQSWKRLDGELTRTRVTNLIIDPQLPANIFAGTLSDGVYKSPDGGRRWLASNTGIQKGTISANVQQIIFDPHDSQTLYAATTVGIFRSVDGGKTWTERMGGMAEVNFVVSLAVDPQHPHILYAGTSGGMYRSKNATDSWVKINSGLVPEDAKMASMALGVNKVVIQPQNTNTIYAATTRGLFKSINGGNSWNKLGESLFEGYVSTLALDPDSPNTLYAGTSKGMFKSLDAGKTWTSINIGLESQNIRTIQIDDSTSHYLFCGTNGGGLYRSRDAGQNWEKIHLDLFIKN